MISQFAIKRFLRRQLEDFTWMKKLERKELLHAVEELQPTPIFQHEERPWNNQLVMFLIGVYLNCFLFFSDMGTGKTRAVLEILVYRKLRGEKNCTLICVLNKTNLENWLIEIEKYAPSLDYVVLDDNHTRLALLEREADVFLIHYPGLTALGSQLKPVEKGSRKRKRVLDKKKLRLLVKKFNGIVLDESTVVMNRSSLIFRIVNQLAKRCDIRFGLTGTPFGKDPLPLWAQFFIVDRGETLGATVGLFKEAFYKKEKNYWGGYEYTFRTKRTKHLRRLIKNRSITYTEGECQDLPKRVAIKKIAKFPQDMEQYYEEIQSKLRQPGNSFREIKHSFLQMRQISSGFLGLKDDETGARAQIEFPTNPKLEMLLSLIDEKPSGTKMIIFHEYIWTGNIISQALRERGLAHERLWSGQKKPRQALRRFRERPEIEHLVVNNNSGSVGLNLQVAKYAVFVESPIRPIIRTQAERRIRRAGQKSKRVFIIDLIVRRSTKNSVDERILASLEKGQNLLKRVLNAKEQL